MNRSIQCFTILIGFLLLVHSQFGLLQETMADEQDKVEIVAGEDRTVYEYRQNGLLMAIKVVPKNGRPYYMVPADGGGLPGDLETARHLYPQWVIIEW
jgi:hypothetical protein